MEKKVVIGCGSAFWGDMLEPALEMAERSDVQYIGFDLLAEVTMTILARQKARNPELGYVPDIVPQLRRLLPITHRRGIRIVTNAGGANPRRAAVEAQRVARELGLTGLRIGVLDGDDLLPSLDRLREAGLRLGNLDTGEQDIDRIRDRIVGAHAYLGADGIVELLEGGAELVITGRVSDSALFVGPILHALGWRYGTDAVSLDRLGAAITVGHVLECASCVTGGMSNLWRIAERPWEVGFPIAEVDSSGRAVITKTPGSGGIVNTWTVKEHLLYEIHDPARYLAPDGVADLTAVRLRDDGPHRVELSGMRGGPRPATLKACLGYLDGFIGEGTAFFPWPEAMDKARWAERWLRGRFERLGAAFDELRFDYVGVDLLQGQAAPELRAEPNEIGLRVSAHAATLEQADVVRREVTHLFTAGPIGTCAVLPVKPRPAVSSWPTLVPRDAVEPRTELLEVPAATGGRR